MLAEVKKKISCLQGILSDQASSFLSHVFFGTESIYFVLSFSSAKETALAISRTTAITQKIEFVNFKEDKFSLLNITALVKPVVKGSLSFAFYCRKFNNTVLKVN